MARFLAISCSDYPKKAMDWSLQEIALLCKAQRPWPGPDCIKGISTDSRQVRPGDLFVALRGRRTDGHLYITHAFRNGAVAALVNISSLGLVPDCFRDRILVVGDTLLATQQLAEEWRSRFACPVIAVAGSNGKTTVKEVLGQLLMEGFGSDSVLVTSGNQNNELGVPLTIFRWRPSHNVAVLELGTSHPGELKRLLTMAKPTAGILSSIGPEHLEFFGSEEGVWEEETELLRFLGAGSIGVVPVDIPKLDILRRSVQCRLITVGTNEVADWIVSSIRVSEKGTTWRLRTKTHNGWAGWYYCPLLGSHQAINVSLALAMCAELGLTPGVAKSALRKLSPVPGRLFPIRCKGEVLVLDDTYNANRASMKVALSCVAAIAERRKGRAIAVLGAMGELGERSAAEHRLVGQFAASRLDALFVFGQEACWIAEAAREAGMRAVYQVNDMKHMIEVLARKVCPRDVVLFKASRFVGLEKAVQLLLEHLDSGTLVPALDKVRCCTG